MGWPLIIWGRGENGEKSIGGTSEKNHQKLSEKKFEANVIREKILFRKNWHHAPPPVINRRPLMFLKATRHKWFG